VDSTDYFLTDNGFNAGVLDGGWINGDFDYSDGLINSTDYFLIDNGFNFHGAPLAAGGSPQPLAAGGPAALPGGPSPFFQGGSTQEEEPGLLDGIL
jgi:hypothetical protein